MICIDIALHLATSIYPEHQFMYGREVAVQYGLHALSCKCSFLKYARHSGFDDITSISLASDCLIEKKSKLLGPDGSDKCHNNIIMCIEEEQVAGVGLHMSFQLG